MPPSSWQDLGEGPVTVLGCQEAAQQMSGPSHSLHLFFSSLAARQVTRGFCQVEIPPRRDPLPPSPQPLLLKIIAETCSPWEQCLKCVVQTERNPWKPLVLLEFSKKPHCSGDLQNCSVRQLWLWGDLGRECWMSNYTWSRYYKWVDLKTESSNEILNWKQVFQSLTKSWKSGVQITLGIHHQVRSRKRVKDEWTEDLCLC